MHTVIHVYTHTHIRIYTYTYIHTYIQRYTYTYIHTCIHADIHDNTHNIHPHVTCCVHQQCKYAVHFLHTSMHANRSMQPSHALMYAPAPPLSAPLAYLYARGQINTIIACTDVCASTTFKVLHSHMPHAHALMFPGMHDLFIYTLMYIPSAVSYCTIMIPHSCA